VNYFAPLSHRERAPVTRDLVWSGLRGHRHLARAARKKILERQITEDTQVKQYESLTRNTIPQVTLRLDQIREACGWVQAAMIKAQQGWEQRKHTVPTFQTGDQVWLDRRNIKTFHPTAKLAPKCHSPFPIIRVLSPITYELRLPAQWKLHPVFHIDLLTPYRETEFHGANYDKPPPDLIDGEEEYEVERIVASRHFG
jgi:hypothetical protein